MTAIRITHLVKRYGTTCAVDDVSLDVARGELFFLLGPSGCGKTTLLRSIAGFVKPDSGDIHFDDRRMTEEPPRRRGIGMVFQNYALWPHLTVADNVAFGLDVRGVAREKRQQAVDRALSLVRLSEQRDRRPTQLSGGQQQRVALARALVIEPAILLLDEPLSNLDARLRIEMREEIRRIHAETRITTVYVTHDQKEALSLADRMGLMDRGRLVQQGSPRDLYLRPVNRFVATFLGDTNLVHGQIVESTGEWVQVETPVGRLRGVSRIGALPGGMRVECSIRPETLRLGEASAESNTLGARVTSDCFLGEIRQVELLVGDMRLTAAILESARMTLRVNDPLHVQVHPSDVTIFAADSPPPPAHDAAAG